MYGRDTEALQQSPPRASLTLRGLGIEKLLLNLRTGAPQTLCGDEISNFKSDFDFLIPVSGRDDLVVHLKQTGPKYLSLRVTFGSGRDAISYEDVPFERVRPGKYQSASKLPLQIVIRVKHDGTVTLRFEDHTEGYEVEAVQKYVNALSLGMSAGAVAFYDESTRRPFLTHTVSGSIPGLAPYKAFIDDAVHVADTYQVPLRMPRAISSTDRWAISRLKQLIDGVTLDADKICLELTKTIDLTPAADALLGGGNLRIMISTPGFPEDFVVFGTAIRTGPLDIEIVDPQVKEPEAFIHFARHAEVGATTMLVFEVTQPAIVRKGQPETASSA